jgi:hypothetical protein
MVHMATKVERQIKRRGSTCFQTNSASSSSTWRPNLKREGVVQLKPYAKAEPPKAKKDTHTNGKGKSESQPTRDRDIKCFKCLGKGHKANKRRKHVVFQPGDWVWVHMRNERFPAHRKSKL